MTSLPNATRIGRMAALSASKATPRRRSRYRPLLTKRNLWPAVGAFLCLLSMGALFWFAWGMTRS